VWSRLPGRLRSLALCQVATLYVSGSLAKGKLLVLSESGLTKRSQIIGVRLVKFVRILVHVFVEPGTRLMVGHTAMSRR
jgi:hypothetical protein